MDEAERLNAIEEIKRLRARFARCLDTKQWKEMEDTISHDCVFDARDGATVTELWHGAEDIVANIRRALESASSVHHAHMPEIEITSPTSAKGLWAMQDYLRFPGLATVDLVGSGHYHESYEKEADGKWRLKTYKLTRLRVDITRTPGPHMPPAPPPRRHGLGTIKAALVTAYGGPDVFSYADVPEPLPGAGELLVKVAAAAVNPVDVKLRNGWLSLFMPLDLPAQLGGDVSGTVEAVGDGVQSFAPGDRVIGMIDPSANGAYAEKIAAPAAAFVKIPEWLDLVEAAALPTGVMTGIQLAELGAKAKPGDRVLVTGAAGSVGRAAVYVAAAAGALVVAGVRSHMVAALDGLPLAGIVDLHDAHAVEAAGPFDAVADTVGGRVAEKLCRYVKPNGILASVVVPPPLPPVGSTIALAPVWVTFNGSRLLRFIDDMHAKGWHMPIVHRLPLSDAARAHTLMEAGSVGGKILLVP